MIADFTTAIIYITKVSSSISSAISTNFVLLMILIYLIIGRALTDI